LIFASAEAALFADSIASSAFDISAASMFVSPCPDDADTHEMQKNTRWKNKKICSF
jgi:hypothetical protein